MIGPLGSGLSALFGTSYSRAGGDRAPALTTGSGETAQDRSRIRDRVVSLRKILERLQDQLTSLRSSPRAQPAFARSSSDLGLVAPGTSTTLTSTGEINTTPTSFSERGPSFAGASGSLVTVSGVYDGSNGTDTLTVSIGRTETIGSNSKSIKVEVRDSGDRKIDQFTIAPGTPADTEYTLDNGLVVSFAAGSVIDGDTFTVDVFAAVGSAVEPDNPFDGTRNLDPNFEPGTTVSAGSFQINDTTIAVGASDTLNDVLARITASDADVVATFDAATETVRLTRKTSGPDETIVVGNDSSGFLAAARLGGAIPVPGQPGDPTETILADVPELAAVASGTATINGVAIAVDVNVDSLNDVLARINSSGAGVTASLQDGRVSILSNDGSSTVVLTDGDTGLFSELRIAPGTYAPRTGRAGSAGSSVVRLFREAAAALRTLLDDPAGDRSSRLDTLRTGLRGAVRRSLGGSGSVANTGVGPRFDLRASAESFLELTARDESRLRSALRFRPGTVREAFVESANGRKGLLPGLIDELKEAEAALRSPDGSSGSVLDTVA